MASIYISTSLKTVLLEADINNALPWGALRLQYIFDGTAAQMKYRSSMYIMQRLRGYKVLLV